MGTDSKTNLTPFRPKQLKSSRAAAPVRSRKFFTGGQHIVSSFSFRDLRIGARLAVGFGSLLVVMLGALLMTTVLDQRSRESLASALQVAHARKLMGHGERLVHIRNWGIHVRRDELVSVMYSTELNSTTSLVPPQRTDRHGILD